MAELGMESASTHFAEDHIQRPYSATYRDEECWSEFLTNQENKKSGKSNLLFDKVQNNALGRKLVGPAKGAIVGPAGFLRFFGLIGPVNLNMAIVPDAAAKGWGYCLIPLDLAEAVGWGETGHFNQDVIYVSGTTPSLEDRWHSKRRIETVNVPIKRAYAARDDGPDLSCWLLARMAQDGLSIFSLLEKVGFIGAISLSVELS